MPDNPYQPPGFSTSPPRRRFPIWAIVVIALAVLLPCGLFVVGAASWFLHRSRAAEEIQRINVPPPREIPVPPPAPLPLPPH